MSKRTRKTQNGTNEKSAARKMKRIVGEFLYEIFDAVQARELPKHAGSAAMRLSMRYEIFGRA